jgi:hypothetical protein
VEDYKKVEKKITKLKDCYVFDLEGKNSIEYDLLDGIENDEAAYCGMLVKSSKIDTSKLRSSSGSEGSNAPEAPLLIDNHVSDIKVKVELPQESKSLEPNQHKSEELLLAE